MFSDRRSRGELLRNDLSPRTAVRLGVAAGVAASLLPWPTAAAASTADATLTGGTLSFINSTPGNVSFGTVTLNGANQTVSKTQPLDVSDARGTGVGWHVTATSTLFTSGSDVLPAGSVTIASSPTDSCDATVTCTLASAGSVSYPFTLPSGATAPPALSLYSAAASSGLGAQTVTPTWQLAVPGSAKAGSYTSTWTYSLVSGP